MPYLGRKGALAPLTSADIPDNIIQQSDIADDAVTGAKLANDIAITTTGALTGTVGDFNWDSNTLVVDSSESRVGVGTASPTDLFHVKAGASGQGTPHSYTEFILESDNHIGINILTPNNKKQQIMFGDPQNVESGAIVYNHSTEKMGFTVEGSERITIDSSGHIDFKSTGDAVYYFGENRPSTNTLNINATADSVLQLMEAESVKVKLHSSGDSYFNGGNVGIGGSPGSLLDIDGPNDSTVTFNFSTYGGGYAALKGHDKDFGGTGSSFYHTFALSLKTQGSNNGNGAERKHLAFYHEGWGSGDLACFYPEPSAGNQQVGIRTQTPGYTLGVDGDIGYSGSITDYSRRRIKENIEELDGSGFIDKFKKIPLYRFRYKPLVQKEELKDLAFREFGEKTKDEILYTEEEGLEEGITAGQVKEPAEWKWDKWEELFPNGYGESKLFDCPDAELKTFLDEKAEELRSTRRTDYHQKHQLQLGLIADDKVLAENFPEVLAYREFTEEGRDDEVWGIKTTAYIGMLHGVLKEAVTRIETLENA